MPPRIGMAVIKRVRPFRFVEGAAETSVAEAAFNVSFSLLPAHPHCAGQWASLLH